MLLKGRVSLATIRKRLGHKNLQTTLRYADKSDASADDELRAWRRQRGQPKPGRASRPAAAAGGARHRPAKARPVGPQPSAGPRKSLRVRLRLNVQNNSKFVKFVRGRKRAQEEIENRCLPFYDHDYLKLDPDGDEYELTLPYEDEADLDRQIEAMLQEIGRIADGRSCFAESDLYAVDDPDRAW